MKRCLLLVGILTIFAFVFTACGDDEKSPVTSTNRAPGQPALDTLAGAPANGSTEVSLTPTLGWVCTDPDGDALTYTVSFGTASPPPVVSTDQSATTYAPASLAYSTTYYWSVTAKDPAGSSASSQVWSFTTLAAPAETLTAPDAPTGPATGNTNQGLAYSAAGSVSSNGHALEYRFDWGDGVLSDWGTIAVQYSWVAAGTYDVKAQARCIDHPTVESEWSSALTVTITTPAGETISTPDIPSGSSAGEVGQSINFATSGAASSEGHPVAYRFDWGNGTISTWTSVATRSYTWSAEGTYEVKVQASCITHPTIMSAWSAALSVTITVPAAETVSAPNAPSGPATGITGENLAIFNEGGAVSSDGHQVEYRFDFGDGEMTNWYHLWTSIQHSWSIAGTYNVTMQARCRTHTTIESPWSTPLSIEISDPAEIIPSPPGAIYGVTDGAINESYEYNVFHSTQTNLGHPVEGHYDWGDGTFSEWSTAADNLRSHMWTTEGTYIVKYQARCSTHTDITAWSDSLVVNIAAVATETVSKPPYASYDRNAEVNIAETYYAYGGTSSLGHDVETKFDWGDGTQSDWVANLSAVSKTWTVAGTYPMTRQSRCTDHPEILSEWSDPININVYDPEWISAPDAPTGPDSGLMNRSVYFYAAGAVNNWGHASEYRFDWGDGTMSDWFYFNIGDSLSHRWTTDRGDFEVRAQARCRTHTAIESEWSLPTVIGIEESVTMSGGTTGPSVGAINIGYYFRKYGSPSTTYLGHAVEYRFDFGDGTISDWSSPDSAAHTYTVGGSFTVKCQARCADHPNAMSDWSTNNLTIDITDAPETISTPSVDAYPATGSWFSIADSVWISANYSTSDYGDSLEYQIDFGDGTMSNWEPAVHPHGSSNWRMVIYHNYSVVGTYEIKGRARCATHTAVVSDWSLPKSIEIFEGIDPPATPTGPTTGTVGQTLTYTTTGTTSSEGHALEYQFYYLRDGSYYAGQSDWTSSLSHGFTFTQAATFTVQVRARCAVDQTAVTGYSEKLTVTIAK